MRKIIVIGGGAAGMFAAYSAASLGKSVILFEKNEKLGKKIYITGKGRCNLTNDTSVNDFFKNVVSNPKFLYSCINCFTPQDTMDFFEKNGMPIKTERGNRVFPLSDKASDVTKTLEKVLIKLGVDIRLNTKVDSLIVSENNVNGVKTDCGEFYSDSVIICCGGISYPLTGSTGDGYGFAKGVGHNVKELKSGLVGIELEGNEFTELQGLSLKNVSLFVSENGKIIFNDFGEMLFTHFGVSGPIVLSCSSNINRKDFKSLKLGIDLKPALDFETLNNRLLRELKENNVKEISNVIKNLLPKSMVNLILNRAGVSLNKKCCDLTQKERVSIINVLKKLEFNVKKLRPVEEAIVTSGGVSVNEINPKTMESKIINGLFFAGEVIDVDALTGGFNLQLAFSTGFVAGENS